MTSFVCELVMAWVLAGVIGHLGTGQVTLCNGVVSGFFLWLGFLATTIAVNQRYEGFGWDLTVIDAGHWLGVAVIMGGVIGGSASRPQPVLTGSRRCLRRFLQHPVAEGATSGSPAVSAGETR